MNIRKQTRYQAVLERMSFGAVPVDGIYWLDPKASAAAAACELHAAPNSAPTAPDKGQLPIAARTAGDRSWPLAAFPWLRTLRRP